jgi:hypothetical protein
LPTWTLDVPKSETDFGWGGGPGCDPSRAAFGGHLRMTKKVPDKEISASPQCAAAASVTVVG